MLPYRALSGQISDLKMAMNSLLLGIKGHTHVKMFGSGLIEVKPVHPRHLSWDIMKYIHTELLGFYPFRYIINIFSYALPFKENEKKMIKGQRFMWFKIYYLCFMSLPGTSEVQIE